jgi:hypothetical protein
LAAEPVRIRVSVGNAKSIAWRIISLAALRAESRQSPSGHRRPSARAEIELALVELG